LAISVIFKQTNTQSKQSRNMRKFAQSGHPAVHSDPLGFEFVISAEAPSDLQLCLFCAFGAVC
jgi:hypothetical protein